MGFHFGGDMQPISQIVDDGAGHLSFLININGEAGGSTHDGTVRCDGPVTIVSEQHMDGAGNFWSQTNGNIYQWEVRCGDGAGAHWVIELAQSQVTASSGQGGAPVGTSAEASLPKTASDSAVTASDGAGESATTEEAVRSVLP